jgi:signal transduction histidine kinase
MSAQSIPYAGAPARERLAQVHRGLRVGFIASVVCAGLLVIAGLGEHWSDPGVLIDPFPAAPAAALLAVAIVLARLAHAQMTLLRRLAQLQDIQRLLAPGHTLDQAVTTLAEFLRGSQHAESCTIVLHDPALGGWRLYVADDNRGKAARGERIDDSLAQALLALPEDAAVSFHRGRAWSAGRCSAFEAGTLEPADVPEDSASQLANLLEAEAFASVPLASRGRPIGRLHLASRRSYGREELGFLLQLVGQAALMIDNARLLDRLALQVASEERRRISLDLHDSTIQPYIGLKLGLEALRRRMPAGEALAREVDELVRMAGDGISHLRSYVGKLNARPRSRQAAPLLLAVREQARRFSEYYGIEAQVLGDTEMLLNAALADELLQIVREALSNVRRHTSARTAAISVAEAKGALRMEIVNDAAAPQARPFHPRSIGERASALGGRVRVEQRSSGHSAVIVEIPV